MIQSSDEQDYAENNHAITTPQVHPFVLAMGIYLLSWQVSYKIPDSCVTALLLFLNHFFTIVATLTFSNGLSDFAQSIPRDIKLLQKIFGINRSQFIQYVVCPKCHSIYNFDSCIITEGNRKESKCCQHISFPNHPQLARCSKCSKPLMKTVRRKNQINLRPFQIFCYRSLKRALQDMLLRSKFINMCEKWRCRNIPHGILADIYDGRVWKEFMVVNGKPFLSEKFNFALSLNVDWFQPFKHVSNSIGVIYLSILNLPRTERYKPENIILCGVIPGPIEPKETINSYLYPLVQELLELWEGVQVNIAAPGPGQSVVRAALICVTSDIPATRKVCGFAGHSASMGCSKCLKRFPSLPNKLDYSGYNRTHWNPRTIEDHRFQSTEFLAANTKTKQTEIIKKYGVRYSILLLLPYFNIVRFHVIDTMHNILLGSAKHVTRVWCDSGVLCTKNLQKIQDIVNSLIAPVDIG